MKKLAISFLLLGTLWAFLLSQTGQTQSSPRVRINPGLNPVFQQCASSNDIAAPQSYLVELRGLTQPQKKVILACVLATVVDDFLTEVSMAQIQAIFQVMPSLKDPDAASLLVPALYRADSVEAAEYLLENTAVLSVKDIREMSHDDFFGLTVTQYQALRGNLPIVEYLITEKFSFSANDNSFLHTIYDVDKSWFLADSRKDLLLRHGVNINVLDDNGNSVLDRAIAEDSRSLQYAFQKMGGLTANVTVSEGDPMLRVPESVARISREFRQHLRADPLPLADAETLFVYERDRVIYAEIRHWHTNTSNSLRLPLPNRNQDNKAITYVTTVTGHGLWVLGPRSVLITPDHDIKPVNISLDTNRGHYIVVGLDDGSLLLLSPSYSGERLMRMERIHVTDPASVALESRPVEGADIPTGGAVAQKLGDGRVLVAGGMHLRGTRTWLYDAETNQWSEQGNISTHRAFPAIAALPDGRAFIASNSSSSSPDRAGTPPSAYSAEIWDPDTGQWTALPPVPLSFRTEAYRALGPSATVLPDGSLILAGGMHRQIMQLRTEGDSFADSWTLVGSTELQRVGARVQALGNDSIAVLGGAGPTDNDQCCWTVPGAERIPIPGVGAPYDTSVSLARNDAALAHRGTRTFIAGGWQEYSMSSPTLQASGIAELIDNATGLTRPLPSLPSPALMAEAQWLDDQRLLVKAIAHGQELHGERKRWDRRSLEGDFEGYLALLDMRTGTWRTLPDAHIARSRLAGTTGNEAILVGPGVENWAVNLDDLSIRQLPSRIAARSDAVVRITADDRIVVAGGMAQKDFFQAESSSCTSDDCPLEWFSYGAVRPSHRYETWDPATNAWQLSAIRQGGGTSAVILDDGRVFALGWDGNRWLVEVSDSNSDDEWQVLPMPDEIATESKREIPSCGDHDRYEPRCSLLRGVVGDTELVFLRSDYWGKRSDTLHALWLYDESEQHWSLIAEGIAEKELDSARILPLRVNGQLVQGAYFGTNVPRLWQEPAPVAD